jgi:hypothetical protein
VAGLLATAVLLTPWLVWQQPTAGEPHSTATRVDVVQPQAGGRTASVGRKPVEPTPCRKNSSRQRVFVSIRHQHLWACAGHRTVLSTAVTTGMTERSGDATPRGRFAVQGIERNVRLTTDGPKSYRVHYWIPFRLGTWGFHDASWQTIPFGSQNYVTRGSHGCVHMPLPAIRRLFHWIRYGTSVVIA